MGWYFETRDLAVGYQGKALISNISVGIEKGEVVTLIGPNGAGKSTILKSITKHLQTVAGTVVIGGDDLHAISYKALAKRVAVVLTNRMNPELMTCYDVVAAGRYPYTGTMGILTPQDERIVEEAMDAVHVLDLGARPYNAISDGQRQRVLLARAICQRPEIIVLDEPTSFLDIRHKLELLSILRSMAKRDGITVILSLHEIDLAEKISDKILCVHGDRIEKFGPPGEIFQEEVIRTLYGIQQGSFNPLFGSAELPRPEGAPRVFVISGSGGGIPVFRALQKEGIPFAAGVLYENDVDFQVARVLATRVVTERPFYPISPQTLDEAMGVMVQCEKVLVTRFPLGPMNQGLRTLMDKAGETGLWDGSY